MISHRGKLLPQRKGSLGRQASIQACTNLLHGRLLLVGLPNKLSRAGPVNYRAGGKFTAANQRSALGPDGKETRHPNQALRSRRKAFGREINAQTLDEGRW